jgi:hypothetical protein
MLLLRERKENNEDIMRVMVAIEQVEMTAMLMKIMMTIQKSISKVEEER